MEEIYGRLSTFDWKRLIEHDNYVLSDLSQLSIKTIVYPWIKCMHDFHRDKIIKQFYDNWLI
jgi:acetone carboxylase gamma subunit